MKNNIDFYATLFGAFASFIKARKMKLKLSNLALQVVIGSALAFLTIGAITTFLKMQVLEWLCLYRSLWGGAQMK